MMQMLGLVVMIGGIGLMIWSHDVGPWLARTLGPRGDYAAKNFDVAVMIAGILIAWFGTSMP
jgi:hypothetical protein